MPIPTEKVVRLEQHADKEWFCSDWYDLVDAPPDEELHHGSRGSIPADTILVMLGDEVIAVGEAFNIEPTNLYAWDNEYYLVLRIREVKEPTLWKTLPWYRFGPGNVVHVWDKFHGIEYFRGQHDPTRSLSYGGDWSHLEHLLDAEHPPAIRASYTEPPGSDQLLSAVRENDLPRVQALIAQGVDVRDLGPPDGVRCLELGVSTARTTSPLWESIQGASPEVTEALLAAGATVDARSEGGFTALHCAIIARRPEHVRVLLRFGADPRAIHAGKTALELAESIDPELAARVRGA